MAISYSIQQLFGLSKAASKVIPSFTNIKNAGLLRMRGNRGGSHNMSLRASVPSKCTLPNELLNTRVGLLDVRHWNCQSVGNKTVHICDYVIANSVDLMFLTETWLRKNDPVKIGELTPPGYTFINVPRVTVDDHHGGIGVLYRDNLKIVQVLNDNFIKISSFEYKIV